MKNKIISSFSFSKKRLWFSVFLAAALLAFNLVCHSSTIASVVFALAALVLGLIRCTYRFNNAVGVSGLIILSFIALFLSQFLLDAYFLQLGALRIVLGTACCAIVIYFVLLISANYVVAGSCGIVLIMVLVTVDYFVYLFRGTELTPSDILAARTAANVLTHYEITLTRPFVYSWSAAILLVFALTGFRFKKRNRIVPRAASTVVLLLSAGALIIGYPSIEVRHFDNGGRFVNGFLVNFAMDIPSVSVNKPDDYDADRIALLENRYSAPQQPASDSDSPVIIAIMDESFADFSILGEKFDTNVEVTPFISSLKNMENTISGYALSSVYGGQTANSEFEFLTGNTMAWLPNGSIPYQQYLHGDLYSMVSVLNGMDYDCIAMHPYLENGWNRPEIYSGFGFDDTVFLDEFEQDDLIREYVSDREMFLKIIDEYENRATDRLFIFGITMQNHGGYTYEGDNYVPSVELNGYSAEYPDAEQYLSLLHESDQAIAQLIKYFSGVDGKVVVVFFGDHLPALNKGFYEEIHGGPFEGGEEELLYTVPFFIWANYDIPEEYVELTSFNFLAGRTFQAAGIETPPYFQFLSDLNEQVAAINSQGYYLKGSNNPADLDGTMPEMLTWYECLQYNNIFDEDRSDVFFSTSQSD